MTVWVAIWNNEGEFDCDVYLTEPPEEIVLAYYVVEREVKP